MSAALEAGGLEGFDGAYDIDGSEAQAQVYTMKGKAYFHHPDTGAMTLREAFLRGIVRREQ